MYRENPDYVLSWLTHGLLEADVAAADGGGRALRIARGMISWFSSLQARPALTRILGYVSGGFPDSNETVCMLNHQRSLTLLRPTVAPTATQLRVCQHSMFCCCRTTGYCRSSCRPIAPQATCRTCTAPGPQAHDRGGAGGGSTPAHGGAWLTWLTLGPRAAVRARGALWKEVERWRPDFGATERGPTSRLAPSKLPRAVSPLRFRVL